jgi:hypothetical protein
MEQSYKDTIITSIQETTNKEELFKVLYSSLEKLYEKEIENMIKSSGNYHFTEYRRYCSFNYDSDSENDKDIVAIPKEFGLLAYLINEEINKNNIMIMDCESCVPFNANEINGYQDGKNKKLIISHPR